MSRSRTVLLVCVLTALAAAIAFTTTGRFFPTLSVASVLAQAPLPVYNRTWAAPKVYLPLLPSDSDLTRLLDCDAVLARFQTELPLPNPFIQVDFSQPAGDKACDVMTIVVPGGALEVVSWNEGPPPARDFATRIPGGCAIVLVYTVPPWLARKPFEEMLASANLVRSCPVLFRTNADTLLGVTAFSAGGLLATALAAHAPLFPLDFLVLNYAVVSTTPNLTHHRSRYNLLRDEAHSVEPTWWDLFYRSELHTTRFPPLVYIWHAKPDDVVPISGARALAKALEIDSATNNRSREVHLREYSYGAHGSPPEPTDPTVQAFLADMHRANPKDVATEAYGFFWFRDHVFDWLVPRLVGRRRVGVP